MKRFVPILIAFIAGAAAGGLLTALMAERWFGPDPDYWVRRDLYLADSAAAAQKLDAALAVIAQKDELIAAKDEEIAAADARITTLQATATHQSAEGRRLATENAALRADAAAVIAANPAIRALIENFDLRCANYEAQVFTLNATLAEERKARAATAEQFVAATFQVAQLRAALDEQIRLRAVCDMLRTENERRLSGSKFWATTGKVLTLTGVIWGGITIAKGKNG